MKALVVFVEVTSYNVARINNVYETLNNFEFDYVYCNSSISGYIFNEELPKACKVLEGNLLSKIKQIRSIFKKK